MTAYAFPPAPQAFVPIVGRDEVFPVRRILCVGQNYAAHRDEMGGDSRIPPFFFSKPADALVMAGTDPAYPSHTTNLHFEIELVVALKAGGSDISADRALDLVFGYAVGVDLTRRDLQNLAKERSQPWESSKGFDQSAPISAILPWDGPAPDGRIALSVNGEVKQDSTVAHMIWSVPEIIAEASKMWRLEAGDLIFTGTPAGVGPVVRGDRVAGEVKGVGDIGFTVV
ncbi:fumarylacetoacetate hydrolase family protein [Phenylobacterium immobile]|uniref:fumarylacetoacetate hydrolase family protein n=1 Tax=Phenylobacterium immobile TaxID=21 RepID=UPI000AAAB4EE|nr:fumarylacetoacetate hydrolase family protein [Phenylobacterium immobile]